MYYCKSLESKNDILFLPFGYTKIILHEAIKKSESILNTAILSDSVLFDFSLNSPWTR